MDLGEVMRAAGFWLEAAERCERGLPGALYLQLRSALAHLAAAVSVRENCTAERALELLADDYVVSRINRLLNS